MGNALYFQNLNLSNLSQANVIEIVTNIQEGFSELLKNDYLTTKNFNSDMTDSVSSQYQSFVAKEMILYDLPLLGKLDTFLGTAYYKHEFDNLNEYTYSDTLKSLIANILNESVSDGSFTIKIMVETWNAKLESLYPEGIPDTSAIFKQLPSIVFESSPESDSDGPIEAKNITDVSNLTFSTNGVVSIKNLMVIQLNLGIINVTTHYVDKKGDSLSPDTEIETDFHTKNQLTATTVSGYHVQNIKTTESLTNVNTDIKNGSVSVVAPTDGEVTFVYAKDQVTYTVTPVDKNGKPINCLTPSDPITADIGSNVNIPDYPGYTASPGQDLVVPNKANGTQIDIQVEYTPDTFVPNNGDDANPISEVLVHRTIQYKGAGVMTPADVVQDVIYKLMTDETTGVTSWTPQNVYSAVVSPNLAGYHVDQVTVPMVKPGVFVLKKGETPKNEAIVTVNYSKDTIVENNGDKTNSVSEVTVHRTINYTGAGAKTPTNIVQDVIYKAVTDKTVGKTVWTPQGFYTAITSPHVAGYTADKETVLDVIPKAIIMSEGTQPADINVTVKYSADTLVPNNGNETNPVNEVTIHRVIHYIGAGISTPKDVIQNVIYKAMTNKTTGETAWTPQGSYAEVTSPIVTGYTAGSRYPSESDSFN